MIINLQRPVLESSTLWMPSKYKSLSLRTNKRRLNAELKYVQPFIFLNAHAQVTHHWLWGAPSCRCGRCRTVAPTSGPCTHTSPGPQSAPGQSAGRLSHAARLYLQTRRENRVNRVNLFSATYIHLLMHFKINACSSRATASFSI